MPTTVCAIATHMGDGDDSRLGSRLSAGFKRSMTGENFFSSVFTNSTQQPLRVSFAAPSPGKIIAVDLDSVGEALICQKGAFPRWHTAYASDWHSRSACARACSAAKGSSCSA